MRIFLCIALLQFFSFKPSAQNNYAQISGDVSTHVADIAASTLFSSAKLIAYSVVQTNGNADMGLMAIDYSNTLFMSSQFHLNNEQLVAKKVLPYGQYVLAERTDLTARHFIRPVIIELNTSTGALVNVHELPPLPFPYQYTRVYDIVYSHIYPATELRILCSATDGTTSHIFEIYFNTLTNQCTFTRYSPQQTMAEIQFLGYVKHYHESADVLGEVSFYGTGIMSSGGRKGFVYFKDFSVPYMAEIYKFANSDLIGFMVNGASSNGPLSNIITMAMTSSLTPSNICLQQKAGLSTLNWRKFYQTQDNNSFYFGYGRGGHGVKGGAGQIIDYFIGTHTNSFLSPHVTILRYDFNSGAIYQSPEFNFTNNDFKTGWPNFCYDPSAPYHFVVDRYNLVNGFKMADANTANNNTDCTTLINFVEITGDLDEQSLVMDITDYPTPVNSTVISLIRTEIPTTIIPECNTEQRDQPIVVADCIKK